MTTTVLNESLGGASGEVVVRSLQESEVDEADRVMRLAFGTFLGAPDPGAVFGDAEMVRRTGPLRRRSMASWLARASRHGGAASGSSGR